MDFTDDDEKQVCEYTPKYGFNSYNSVSFDDHIILGQDYIRYKPEKIIFWTSQLGVITGIQTWYRNIINNNYIHSGENKGLDSKYKHEFNLKPNEYLTNCEIMATEENIAKINLKTNLGQSFEIGITEGKQIPLDYLGYGNKIIISFMGNFNKCLESFGLHIIDYKEYMKVMFIGYYELKKKLKDDEKRKEYLLKMNNKEYEFEDKVILRTCMLPNGPFNEIMKYCVF